MFYIVPDVQPRSTGELGGQGGSRRRGRVPRDLWRRLGIVGIILLVATQLFRCSLSGYAATEPGAPIGVATIDAGSPEAVLSAAPSPPVAVKEAPPPEGKTEDEPPAEAAVRPTPPPPADPAPFDGVEVCPDPSSSPVRVWFSPARPVAGRLLRVTAIAESELAVKDLVLVVGSERVKLDWFFGWGGPPWAWTGTLEAAPAGVHKLVVVSDGPGRPFACVDVDVAASPSRPRQVRGVWPVERAWDRDVENLYAAWVGRLFRVDPGARAGWRPLHVVFRDAKRNILWGYLGLDEDNAKADHVVVAEPDCGDTPFYLRAYFAWKLHLPYAIRHCLRGTRERGTRCDEVPETNLTEEWDRIESPIERFNEWLDENVGDTAHSGTGRMLPEIDPSELYPIALSRETLRPGTVFVDAGGHVLVVSQWVPGTAERIGMLLAIDAHPDRTVSHKRFSRANFFFDSALRTGGFKAFRPVVYRNGRIRFASNADLAADPGYPDVSLEQYEFRSPHAFYRTVDKLLNPEPLDPLAAYRSHMEGLLELLEERVAAVKVGIDYMESTNWAVIPMPQGAEIFETTGPWEDYSTPARDLRLLIALDELVAFPETVLLSPAIFRIPAGKEPAAIERELAAEWRRSSEELGLEYARSDGSPWRLSLAEVVRRIDRFQQAYNPNECPEVRWGAARNTPEYSTCTRHAPKDQVERMLRYRWWHAERYRPSGR